MKKAQLKMGENIAILFIFILLVVFGMVFFFRVQKAGIEIKQEENKELSAIQVAQKVSFLPEVRCSNENVVVPDCYDILKMQFAAGVINDTREYYFPLFKFSEVYVDEVFPGTRSWVLYNYTGDKESRSLIQIPVSIYDPKTSALGSYYFGILNVGVWT